MNEETRASEPATIGIRNPNRRTVVRSAAHAAWAVPVISTVTAAPAFAAASDVFTVTSAAVIDNGRNYIDVTVTIGNPVGGQLSASGVVVSVTSITFSPSGATVASASIPSGWSATDPLPLPYDVTYGSSIPNSGSTSVTIRFTFGSKPANGTLVTVAGTVTVPSFTPNQQSFSAADTA